MKEWEIGFENNFRCLFHIQRCLFHPPAETLCKCKNRRMYLWPAWQKKTWFTLSLVSLSASLFTSCSCMPLKMAPSFGRAYCMCRRAACFHTKLKTSLLTFLPLSCNTCFIGNGISCSKFNQIFLPSHLVSSVHSNRALQNITKRVGFSSYTCFGFF